jgi:hypothetical protein
MVRRYVQGHPVRSWSCIGGARLAHSSAIIVIHRLNLQRKRDVAADFQRLLSLDTPTGPVWWLLGE